MRNPLGGPDVMGCTGAWSGGAEGRNGPVWPSFLPRSRWRRAVSCVVIVWLLARQQRIETFRMIIIGIRHRAM